MDVSNAKKSTCETLVFFCGPHLPLAFQFVFGLVGGGTAGFPLIWLRRRRRSRDTVQLVVFVGGPRLKTFVPLGTPTVKRLSQLKGEDSLVSTTALSAFACLRPPRVDMS